MSVGQDFDPSLLERKDRAELAAIATSLGEKPPARAKKADIVSLILRLVGADGGGDPGAQPTLALDAEPAPAPAGPATPVPPTPSPSAPGASGTGSADDAEAPTGGPADAAPVRDRAGATLRGGGRGPNSSSTEGRGTGAPAAGRNQDGGSQQGAQHRQNPSGGTPKDRAGGPGASPGGGQQGGTSQQTGSQQGGSGQQAGNQQGGGQQGGNQQGGGNDEAGPGNQADPPRDQGQGDDESGNRRRRRRGRDRDRRPDGTDDQGPLADPVEVTGFVDLRDEGYGFLRIAGYLPSRDDAYISVKQARQFGLRKGDVLKGRSRPANRNEKNPALLQVDEVNGRSAHGEQPTRRDFEDLTPLFPDSRLRLEQPEYPENMTARIIDLLAPIGKGQRGLIVSPPKAGKTTVMKQVVRAIERNHPEVHLIVLLVDERPEEVTDMKRWLIKGEVAASTFDRPTEEHTAVAELVLERAKRLVEAGEDVVIMLDGITRLARAYNLAAPANGRTMAGGIDTGALYPPKKFFGAARNVEEGGSLTILATALVETNTRMDEVIFEEFKGTGNMELKLDRRLADRRIYPAIDVDASSTRHEELLYDRKQLQQIYRLRRVLSGLKDEGGSSAAGLEMLTDRLKTFKTNDAFLDEIGKAAQG